MKAGVSSTGRMLAAAVVAVIVISAGAFAQDIPQIAVYVTGEFSVNEKAALGTRMLVSLVNSGRYKGAERAGTFLTELEKERQNRGTVMDDSQISETAKRFDIQYVCVADISPVFEEFQVSARVVNVETVGVEQVGVAASPLKSMSDLVEVSDLIVKSMFGGQAAQTVEPVTEPAMEAPTPVVAQQTPNGPISEPDAQYAAAVSGQDTPDQAGYKTKLVRYDEPDGKSRRLKKRISLEAGGTLLPIGSYNSDNKSVSGMGGGGYLRADFIYAEIIIDAVFGEDYEDGLFGILAKFPIGNDLIKAIPEFIQVSPLFGYGTIWGWGWILGSRLDVGISEIVYLRSEYLYGFGSSNDGYGKESYSSTSFKIGGGLDLGLGERKKFYLRPELMYNWTWNTTKETSSDSYWYVKDRESKLSVHHLDLRLGIGYKWGGDLVKEIQVLDRKILSAGTGGFYGYSGGWFAFFDVKYLEAFIGTLGSGVYTGGVVKVPFGSEKVKFFPLAGFDYIGVLDGGFGAFGAGVDLDIYKDTYLRTEYMHHVGDINFPMFKISAGRRF